MKKKKLIWQIPFLLILIVGTIVIIRQQHNTPYQKDTGFIFGTIYHITYQSDTNYQQEIETELKKVDQSLSPFNKTSVITQVNQGKDIEVDEMFTEVFRMAESISKETNGAFDITVAPMVNLWGFGFKQGVPPTKAKIDSIKTLVGYEKVALEKGRIIKQNPKIMLDCSAIAKGYGSDIVAMQYPDKLVNLVFSKVGQAGANTDFQGTNGTVSVESISKLANISIRYNNGTVEEVCGEEEKFKLMGYEAKDFYRYITEPEASRAEYEQCSALAYDVSVYMEEIRKLANIRFPSDN